MKELSLTNSDKTFLVDSRDWPLVRKSDWYLDKVGYVLSTRHLWGKNAKLHRVIIGAKPGEIIDHKNGNRLDNRRRNLRLATFTGNAVNTKPRKDNTSGYRGVFYCSDCKKKWRACIRSGHIIHVGLYETPKEAALAYNKAAIQYHGEYAILNTII